MCAIKKLEERLQDDLKRKLCGFFDVIKHDPKVSEPTKKDFSEKELCQTVRSFSGDAAQFSRTALKIIDFASGHPVYGDDVKRHDDYIEALIKLYVKNAASPNLKK